MMMMMIVTSNSSELIILYGKKELKLTMYFLWTKVKHSANFKCVLDGWKSMYTFRQILCINIHKSND